MMTNDDLANQTGDLVREIHSRIEALDDGPVKIGAQRLAAQAHGSLEKLRNLMASAGQVQPFSGGDPKPPAPPPGP